MKQEHAWESSQVVVFLICFSLKHAKNWYTRCTRWCNDYNLGDLNYQFWLFTLTTNLENQPRLPSLTTKMVPMWCPRYTQDMPKLPTVGLRCGQDKPRHAENFTERLSNMDPGDATASKKTTCCSSRQVICSFTNALSDFVSPNIQQSCLRSLQVVTKTMLLWQICP